MKYRKYAASNDNIHPEATTRVVGIKTNNYSSRIPQILEMVAIAKQDFPGLKDEDIRVVSYDGDRWKRQTGIEFDVDISSPLPDDYHVGRLEYVFAGN